MLRKTLATAALLAASSTFSLAADELQVQPVEPQWEFSVGALYLVRDNGSSSPLFYDGSCCLAGSTVYSTTGDLGKQSSFGFEAALSGEVNGSNVQIRGMWTADAN